MYKCFSRASRRVPKGFRGISEGFQGVFKCFSVLKIASEEFNRGLRGASGGFLGVLRCFNAFLQISRGLEVVQRASVQFKGSLQSSQGCFLRCFITFQ